MESEKTKVLYVDCDRDLYVLWLKEVLDALAESINQHLFEGCRDWYWIGDHNGGICCFDDTDYLNVEDMILILEENVTYEQYEEWHCAELDHPERHINLRSWLMGARHDMFPTKVPDIKQKAREAFASINHAEYQCALAESQYSEPSFDQVKKEYSIAENAFIQGAIWMNNHRD